MKGICILLVLFLLNLSTFLPWRSEKIEFHSNDISEEMVKLIQADEDKKLNVFICCMQELCHLLLLHY